MGDDYNKLSVAEKRKCDRDRMCEPTVACPHCEARTTVEDLLKHVAERCPGKRTPHHRSKWVTWTVALAMGVPDGTLRRWVSQGRVRTEGEPGARRYLERDIARQIAARVRTAESGG